MMQLDKIIRLSEPNPSLPSNLCVSPKTPSLQTMAAFPICSTSNSPLKVTATSPAPAPFAQKHNQLSLRREFLKGLSLLPLLELKHPRPSSAAKEIEVGVYLPPSPSDPSFVFFKASPKDTPALRAGTHSFILSFFCNLSSHDAFNMCLFI
jgi:hypothetical protein